MAEPDPLDVLLHAWMRHELGQALGRRAPRAEPAAPYWRPIARACELWRRFADPAWIRAVARLS